jgi:hypothetical protein
MAEAVACAGKLEELRSSINSRHLRPLEFQTERQHGNGQGASASSGIPIKFTELVRGPLSFGAHFGPAYSCRQHRRQMNDER